MHESVMAFGEQLILRDEIAGRDVLEVGSFNVNGSLRGLIQEYKPGKYVGIDVVAGPGVDLVLDARYIPEAFGEKEFDFVLSTEMLEHAQSWRAAVKGMKTVLKPGGVLLLTTRGPGFPYHNPPDYWRFTVGDMKQVFDDFVILFLAADPQVPGVFVKAQRRLDDTRFVDLSEIEVATAGMVAA